MDDMPKLSLGEFVADLKSVIITPSERFAVIQERGAIWGSLVLLAIPIYFVFNWTGGVYFDPTPFPGYAFLIPAIVAIALSLLKVILIHFFASLFQRKGHDLTSHGTCRKLLVVFGYSTIPGTLALIVGLLIFLLMPIQVGALLRDYHAVTMSVLIAAGVALFIWNLILTILALRTVYPIHDVKIVLSFALGSILAGIGPAALSVASVPIRVDYLYLQPMLSEPLLRFVAVDPLGHMSRESKVMVHIDMLAYRSKPPGLFDLVAFSTDRNKDADSHHDRIFFRRPSWDKKIQAVGHIVGLPGDSVELVDGQLKINGQSWSEPYLAPEFRSSKSFPLRHLGGSEYAIFPANRDLLSSAQSEWVVTRDRITGRVIMNKWPLGWLLFRHDVFLQPQLSPASAPK
jgi:hypothetical protein